MRVSPEHSVQNCCPFRPQRTKVTLQSSWQQGLSIAFAFLQLCSRLLSFSYAVATNICTGFPKPGAVWGRKNLPLWKETKPLGFSGLYRWNTLEQFGSYSHKAKWGQSWNKQKACKVILGYRKHMPGLTKPLLLQIPSKWQEQKHNSVISNYTDSHTEPHNRKMLVLLVKTQTTKLHLEGGRAACCRNHYGETAL